MSQKCLEKEDTTGYLSLFESILRSLKNSFLTFTHLLLNKGAFSLGWLLLNLIVTICRCLVKVFQKEVLYGKGW